MRGSSYTTHPLALLRFLYSFFDGCNESSDLFFPVPDTSVVTLTSSEAFSASQALLDQVFLDSSLGNFDSDPTLTFGCNNGNVCSAMTPVFPVSDTIFVIGADNWTLESIDSPAIVGRPINADSSPFLPNPGSDTQVFAIWSNTSAVPVPAAVWLFCSGLIGLIGLGRKSSWPSKYKA